MTEGRKKPAGPRKATVKHLENKALHYLARFATSRDNLRRVLMRAILLSARHHGTDPEAGARDVEALLDRFAGSGLIDDVVYAEGRVRSLRERGLAGRNIRLRLRQKGIASDVAEAALGGVDEQVAGDAELAAAAAFARRRRLGPFRPEDARAGQRDRDMAILARAGFSFGIVRTVIEADSPEELSANITGSC